MTEFLKDYFTIDSPVILAGQIIGIIAMIFSFVVYQQNDRKRMLILKGITNAFWVVHFFMIGAHAGAVLNFIGIPREFVFYHNDKKWAKNIFWPILFVLITITSSLISWEGYITLLPCFGSVLAVIAFAVKSVKLTRFLNIPANTLWLIYVLITRSYGGALANIIILTSIFIAIVRYDIQKEKKEV